MKTAKTTFALLIIACVVTILPAITMADRPANGRSPVVSGKLPGHYPARFEAVGKITNIDGYYTWSINGKKMNVSPNISIHSLVTANSSRYSIKQGMNIAYKTNSQGVITEAWEIPEDSIDLN